MTLTLKQTLPTHDFTPFTADQVEQSVSQRFERQARLHADRRAIKTMRDDLTYDQLNRMANRIARAVLARVTPSASVPVAVLMEQGAPAVAAFLGVLKAGGFLTLLEPGSPRPRTEYILANAGPSAIVTNAGQLSLARELVGDRVPIINIDAIDAAAPDDNLGRGAGPDDVLYLLYTSGSTGQPKGVVHTHRNLLHDIMNRTNLKRLRPEDRLSLLTAGTGQAVKNMFGALLNGASLFPFEVKEHGLGALAAWLRDQRITIYTSGAALFRQFAQSLRGRDLFPDLRLIRLGSEAVTSRDIELYREHFTDRCLFANVLSSNEAGLIRCMYLDKHATVPEGVLPVGHAVADVQILLLDDGGRPVAPGGVGEIAVKSRYLAKGYWRRPDLTQKAFASVPGGNGEQIFHTGDLGRLRPDGCLEFHGRKDFRVKIRGYRVETVEVEAALTACDNVASAAVVAHADEDGNHRLVAYIVPKHAPAPTISELRRRLAVGLADYMVPAVYVTLDAMPMLPSGKIDRRSLPPPGRSRPALDTPHVAPRTPVERGLTDIWAQVLRLDQVGIHDNFLELGGDSLRACQVVARAINAFNVDVPLRVLFESPTIVHMASVIQAMQGESGASARPAAPLSRRDPSEPAVLSFGQQRQWFINRLEPESPAYNTPKAVRLRGRLDVDALRKAVTAIVGRHEVLRTRYTMVEQQLVTETQDAATVSVAMPLTDLSDTPEPRRDAELRRLMLADGQRPFDLSRDIMLRAAVFRLAAEDHVLLLTTHHIASDGWSRGVLMRDLSELYRCFATGDGAMPPPLPIQYADFAAWQRRAVEGPAGKAQLDYWRRRLDAAPPALALPTDRPRPAIQTYGGATLLFTVPEPLMRTTQELAQRQGATLFMALHAAFVALLHRYTGQDDIVVGAPVAGRSRIETEGLIGFFVNMLAMRTTIGAEQSFRELIRGVRDTAIAAYAHQDVPFEKLVEDLAPKRDLSRNPFFQVTFDVHTRDYYGLELAGVTAESFELDRGTCPFDQAWNLMPTADGIRGRVEFNTDMFDADTVRRMAEHFTTLLAAAVRDPDAKVADLPLLNEAQRREVVAAWNDTAIEYPDARPIHEQFAAQAALSSAAEAVIDGDRRVTYAQLNAQANQLAHHLRTLGVERGSIVGVCMDRSPELLVALLGVLKAGGAYVPMDPALPAERLKYTLDDGGARVLLTHEGFTPPFGGTLVRLDKDWPTIARQSTDDPRAGVAPDDLAYLIYTSGSTGRPKGVAIEHRGLTNYLNWCTRAYNVRESGGTVLFSSIAFDLSVTSLFAPLCVGRAVELIVEPAVDQLIARLRRPEPLGFLKLTPTHLEMLGQYGLPARDGASIGALIIGGEALHYESLKPWFERSPATRIINEYGPTETVVGSVVYEVPHDAAASGAVPIGRPLANTRVYVLDRRGNPVPVGVPGELFIGGAGVARRYHQRPDLTEQRFVPDPFDAKPDSRLYRTGDLARWRSDGQLEYLGRIDEQVKLRGYRIELGEIESALRRHERIHDAVVALREDSPGDKRLVAYVVMDGVSNGQMAMDLRRFLEATLPEYMIPSAFVALDALPQAASGKVDRRALPAPDAAASVSRRAYIAPSDDTQHVLAAVWSELLGVDRVGVEDNFFELGGHSLLAARVVNRIRDLFSIGLPLRSLFETPTVGGLAARMLQGADADRVRRVASLLLEVMQMTDEEAAAALETKK